MMRLIALTLGDQIMIIVRSNRLCEKNKIGITFRSIMGSTLNILTQEKINKTFPQLYSHISTQSQSIDRQLLLLLIF